MFAVFVWSGDKLNLDEIEVQTLNPKPRTQNPKCPHVHVCVYIYVENILRALNARYLNGYADAIAKVTKPSPLHPQP